MKRYAKTPMGGPETDLFEDPDGDYVEYADVEAEFAKLRYALRQIAKSYPVTEEGETLATIAAEALVGVAP